MASARAAVRYLELGSGGAPPSSAALDPPELHNRFLQSRQTHLKGSRSVETANMSLTEALATEDGDGGRPEC